MNKHKADGYDVCATTDCQVYGGIAVEDARTNRAVYDTKGLVMVYNDKPIPALFHCSSGGYTENSENVWGGYFPYLRAVKDFDEKSPYYKWEKKVLAADLEAALKRAGYVVGKLQTVELSPLDAPVKSATDRGVSGRVKSIRFIGSQGIIVLSGIEVRSMMGLNSTLFDVKVVLSPQEKMESLRTNSHGDSNLNRRTEHSSVSKKRHEVKISSDNQGLNEEARTIFLFEGYGWGHGLGLSQWGAKAMAEQAPVGAAEYFKVILKHYYLGVSIEKEY